MWSAVADRLRRSRPDIAAADEAAFVSSDSAGSGRAGHALALGEVSQHLCQGRRLSRSYASSAKRLVNASRLDLRRRAGRSARRAAAKRSSAYSRAWPVVTRNGQSLDSSSSSSRASCASASRSRRRAAVARDDLLHATLRAVDDRPHPRRVGVVPGEVRALLPPRALRQRDDVFGRVLAHELRRARQVDDLAVRRGRAAPPSATSTPSNHQWPNSSVS